MNPRPKPIVELFECSPWDASGISSSTTTKIMAPAAKAKKYTLYVLRKAGIAMKKEIKSLLLVSTGALMSTTSSLQGESIPGIAHAVAIEYK